MYHVQPVHLTNNANGQVQCTVVLMHWAMQSICIGQCNMNTCRQLSVLYFTLLYALYSIVKTKKQVYLHNITGFLCYSFSKDSQLLMLLPSWLKLFVFNPITTLLSNSEIFIPRNALALASLPNLKYKFPKQKYKILKRRRTYQLDRELYIFHQIYIFRNRKKSEWNFQNFSRCMSLEPSNFR